MNMKKIVVGSLNPIKIEAVREVMLDYSNLSQFKVTGKETSSGVSKQPLSLDEIVKGANNRAKNSFDDVKHYFSVGIESGLMKVPYSNNGYMDVCVCSIYDGQIIYSGLSRAFPLPSKIAKLVLEKGKDLEEAFYECGITTEKDMGSKQGAIGLLTKGRVTRKEQIKDAIQMAFIEPGNRRLYQ